MSELLIKQECIIGVNTDVNSVHALDSDKVLYCSSNHVVVWMKFEKKQIFVHNCSPRERIQQIELCASHRTIAIIIVGENGTYIQLYDAIELRRKIIIRPNDGLPGSILGLSFTKDGKECLILGDAPDYMLSLWNLEKVPKMLASIRLATPSGKEIRHASICPSDGRLVCVSGNGIVRFFRIIDNLFRPVTVKLRGKQQDYVHHCWFQNDTIILATPSELIIIRNFETRSVIPIDGWNQFLVSIAPLSCGIIIGGNKGSIRLYHTVGEKELMLKLTRDVSCGEDANVLAFDSIESENLVLCLISSGKICTVLLSNFGVSQEDALVLTDVVPSLVNMDESKKLMICMDICSWKTILAIGTPDKSIRIWDYGNRSFDLLHSCEDEIVSLSLHPTGLHILICTKAYVELSDVHLTSLSSRWRQNIATNGGNSFSTGGQYFALLIGEFVQVYNSFTQDLVSTLRGHTALVQSVCWKDDDFQIATVGRDGVLCIWNTWTGDRIHRFVNEDAVYLSGFATADFSTAVVNTDNGVQVFDINSQTIVKDYEWPRDAYVIACSANIVLCTSLDPNNIGHIWLRKIYEKGCNSRGLTIHSHSVTCARISPDRECVFTASEDGSICFSTLNHRLFPQREYKYNEDVGPITLTEFLVSPSDLKDKDIYISSLREDIDIIKARDEEQFEALQKKHDEGIHVLKKQLKEEEELMANKIRAQNEKVAKVKKDVNCTLCREKEHLNAELQSMKEAYANDIKSKKMAIQELQESGNKDTMRLETEIGSMRECHTRRLEDLRNEYGAVIKVEQSKAARLQEEMAALENFHFDMANDIEEQAEIELLFQQQTFESTSHQEILANRRLMEEIYIRKKKHASLVKDSEEHKESISTLQEKHLELNGIIDSLRMARCFLEDDIQSQNVCIIQLQRDTNLLSEDIDNKERSKTEQTEVLSNIEEELRQRGLEQNRLGEQLECCTNALKKESDTNGKLRVQLQQHQLKLNSVKKEHTNVLSQKKDIEKEVVVVERKIARAKDYADDLPSLKRYLIHLSNELLRSRKPRYNEEDSNINVGEGDRERNILQQRIQNIEETAKRRTTLHDTNMARMQRDQNILSQQLREIEVEIKYLRDRQGTVLASTDATEISIHKRH